jgi:hypothetical protein
MENLVISINPLAKTTSREQLTQYFNEVFRLHESGEEFPVVFDMVWPLVYERKADAVSALVHNHNFLQDIDYQFLRQNPEKSERGRPVKVYKLSVPCLEYFIARKVREVFEVYRLVFHTTRKTDPEIEKLKDMVNHASSIVGSVNKLAKHMGISAGTLTNLFKRSALLSADMRIRIETTCTQIIENGVGVDPELVELLLDVEDKDTRKKLWKRYYC